MQEKHLYEYAVLRVVPRVEREEFLNVGIILFCNKQRFLQCRFAVDKKRLLAFSPGINLPEIEERLAAFKQICAGKPFGGAIGQLPLASRFRWLTATRSTIIQISAVHPGLCQQPQETLDKLFNQLVLQQD